MWRGKWDSLVYRTFPPFFGGGCEGRGEEGKGEEDGEELHVERYTGRVWSAHAAGGLRPCGGRSGGLKKVGSALAEGALAGAGRGGGGEKRRLGCRVGAGREGLASAGRQTGPAG